MKTDSVAASPPSAVNVQRPLLGGRTRRQTLAAAGQRATNGSSCVVVALASFTVVRPPRGIDGVSLPARSPSGPSATGSSVS